MKSTVGFTSVHEKPDEINLKYLSMRFGAMKLDESGKNLPNFWNNSQPNGVSVPTK